MDHNEIIRRKLGRHYPFQSRYLDRNGLRYHYLDEGAGDPVIMVHGNPTWSFYYRRLVMGLSPNRRTIVPDHMGCGLSDRPDDRRYAFTLESRIDDLEALVDHLGLTQGITLVVHDWGGAIGVGLAARRPQAVARLVILNTAAFLPPAGKRIPLTLWLVRNVRFLAEPLVLGLNAFARGALYMASHKGLSREARAGLIAPYDSPKNRLATLRFVQDIPLRPGDPSYGEIKAIQGRLHLLEKIPTLICWGRHDFVFDRDYLNEWRRRFPRAEVHEFPNAGHYVLEDEPEAILGLTRDFLARHPLEPPTAEAPRP